MGYRELFPFVSELTGSDAFAMVRYPFEEEVDFAICEIFNRYFKKDKEGDKYRFSNNVKIRAFAKGAVVRLKVKSSVEMDIALSISGRDEDYGHAEKVKEFVSEPIPFESEQYSDSSLEVATNIIVTVTSALVSYELIDASEEDVD